LIRISNRYISGDTLKWKISLQTVPELFESLVFVQHIDRFPILNIYDDFDFIILAIKDIQCFFLYKLAGPVDPFVKLVFDV